MLDPTKPINIEYYYLGTGELSKMYTLRHYMLSTKPYNVVDNYIQNLSIDLDEAQAKARSMVGDKFNDKIDPPTLGEIVRRHYSPEELEILNRMEQEAAEERERVFRAGIEEILRDHPAVQELIDLEATGKLDPNDRNTEFLASVMAHLTRTGNLSDRQLETLPNALERYHEALNAPTPTTPLEEGRHELEGEVVSLKYKDTPYGVTYKMLVKLPCLNKVYGTVPTAIADNVEKGNVIVFTAKVQRSRDDKHFGFFSRPSKPRIVIA